MRRHSGSSRKLGGSWPTVAFEPAVGDAVEITVVVEHLRGRYAKPSGDIVQPDSGPAAPFLRERNRRVHDPRR